MRIVTPFLLAMLVSVSAVAQDRVVSGYYVNNNRDTIRGFIQNRVKYNHSFKFKTRQKGKMEKLTIDQVSAFGFTSGETFARIMYSAPGVPETMVFTRVLVEGGMDLYKFRSRFLIGSDEKGRHRLEAGKTASTGDGLKRYQANLGIFNILMQDCATAKNQAQKTPISQDALIKLLRSYNSCLNLPHAEFTSTQRGHNNTVGLFVGQSFSSLSYSSVTALGNEAFLNATDFGSSSNPTFGAVALLGSRKQSSIFAFQGEVVYSKADFTATSVYRNDIAGYTIIETTETKINYSSLTFRGGIRLTMRSNTLNPYIVVGLSNQVFLASSGKAHRVTQINSTSSEEDFDVEIGKLAVPLWVSAGLKKRISGKKAIFVDVTYEKNNMGNSGKLTTAAIRAGFMF